MPATYNTSSPEILKDEKTGEIKIHHNHSPTISYVYRRDKPISVLDPDKTSVKACITFFKIVADHKPNDVKIRAAAASALVEDKALLKEIENTGSRCSIQ